MTSQATRESPFQMAARVAAQSNQFPQDDGCIRRQSIHITPGIRAMDSQEIKRAHDLACGSGQYAAIWVPITYAGRAAIARATARTTKEVKVADLMVFVAKYREHKPGIVIFPAWLSEGGRRRLIEIAMKR